MDEICRLCCSSNFVKNDIFDEESAIYLKMSLYLPIKVFKNDRLPQRICDKCSCKVNDFYQFCNETIEVQNRLRASLKDLDLPAENMIDLGLVKKNVHSPPPLTKAPYILAASQHRATQTEVVDQLPALNTLVRVKEEPKVPLPLHIKEEDDNLMQNIMDTDFMFEDDVPSDDSDISLNTLKKRKKKPKKLKNKILELTNGDIKENKKGRKRKRKLKDLESIVKCALPEGTTITAVSDHKVDVAAITNVHDDKATVKLDIVKMEADDDMTLDQFGYSLKLKRETGGELEDGDWRCCVCFMRCCLRSQMLQHYKSHAEDGEKFRDSPPETPSIIDGGYYKCTHCTKVFKERGGWLRHSWRHQRRPYRCALCEKTFRDPAHILKHGQTHSMMDGVQPLSKRFVCDMCPEEFVYMRYLLEHRASHPEARGRKLVHRCVQCSRTFAHLNSLRRHLRAHSGERNHLCNVCGKALSSREHLKFHIRIHTGYKPNVCKTCGKAFVKKCNLTLHERVHSGEKPHVCSHCGKAFSQRSTLVIHERYHSGARPYVCSLCGRGFVAKGLLSMHLKTTCI